MKKLAITICLAAAHMMLAQSSGSGSISGKLIDDTGAGVSQAYVFAILQITTAGQKPVVVNTLSAGDGSFVLNNLPAGQYQICFEKRAAQVLNPCVWGPTPISVIVAAGRSVSEGTLPAETGVLLTVRVNDPLGLIAATAAKDDVLIGTGHAGSPFVPATLQERDATGKTVSLLVRKATAANVSVFSKYFVLGNSTGTAFGTPGVLVPVTPSATSSVPGAPGNGQPDLTIVVVRPAAASLGGAQ